MNNGAYPANDWFPGIGGAVGPKTVLLLDFLLALRARP